MNGVLRAHSLLLWVKALDYVDYRSSSHLKAYGDLRSMLSSPLGLQIRRPY